MNIPVTPIIKRRLKISCFRKVDVFCVLYSPTNPRQHIAAYISSAISLDFKKEIPNIPEKDCAFFLFCPTDRKRSEVRISMQISPSTAIYFNVISNVKIKISGIWNERRLAVNLFQDVPADRIPISVTDTNTLVVIISKICGFPINTAGKSISAEKSTAPVSYTHLTLPTICSV